MTSESSYSHGPTRIFLVAGLNDGNEPLYIKKRWYIRISKQERLRYACNPKFCLLPTCRKEAKPFEQLCCRGEEERRKTESQILLVQT